MPRELGEAEREREVMEDLYHLLHWIHGRGLLQTASVKV